MKIYVKQWHQFDFGIESCLFLKDLFKLKHFHINQEMVFILGKNRLNILCISLNFSDKSVNYHLRKTALGRNVKKKEKSYCCIYSQF